MLPWELTCREYDVAEIIGMRYLIDCELLFTTNFVQKGVSPKSIRSKYEDFKIDFRHK